MKKFLTFVCMLACIFGLTACGSEKALTEYEQYKVDMAQQLAVNSVVPLLGSFMSPNYDGVFDEYTMEEIAYQVESIQYQLIGQVSFEVDGYGFYTAVESFQSAADSIGSIVSMGNTTARIDGNQIIVEVEVTGEKKNAVAEVIFSNDLFFVMESAALNPNATIGQLMTGAALNTVIGMGTVFAVLLLISGIISCFGVIPKLQKKAAEKKAAKSAAKSAADKETTADNASAQIAFQETSGDELELAAVIAAAVAAYEGSASTDGFVVRSIRRLR